MRDAGQQVHGGRRAARHGVAAPAAPARGARTTRRTGRTARGAGSARSAPARLARRAAPIAATLAVLSLGLTLALAPQPAAVTAPAAASGTFSGDTQTVSVPADVTAPASSHESYASTTGPETLVESGTNLDWAKLVLIEGDWPVTEENVTFMMRWMRQENGADNWWNRNNPLNNGQGSGGGSGLGSYATLLDAAYYAAENLQSGRYPAVDAALARGDSADATAQAIWASPWASSHYGYGTHWSSRPYEIIQAPADAWG